MHIYSLYLLLIKALFNFIHLFSGYYFKNVNINKRLSVHLSSVCQYVNIQSFVLNFPLLVIHFFPNKLVLTVDVVPCSTIGDAILKIFIVRIQLLTGVTVMHLRVFLEKQKNNENVLLAIDLTFND